MRHGTVGRRALNANWSEKGKRKEEDRKKERRKGWGCLDSDFGEH